MYMFFIIVMALALEMQPAFIDLADVTFSVNPMWINILFSMLWALVWMMHGIYRVDTKRKK